MQENKTDILKSVNNISEGINEKRAVIFFVAVQRGKLHKSVRSSVTESVLMELNVIVEGSTKVEIILEDSVAHGVLGVFH